MWHALVVQAVLAAISLLLLDGGSLARCIAVATLAFEAGGEVILIRRLLHPRPRDRLYFRWGFLLLTAVVWLLGALLGFAPVGL